MHTVSALNFTASPCFGRVTLPRDALQTLTRGVSEQQRQLSYSTTLVACGQMLGAEKMRRGVGLRSLNPMEQIEESTFSIRLTGETAFDEERMSRSRC